MRVFGPVMLVIVGCVSGLSSVAPAVLCRTRLMRKSCRISTRVWSVLIFSLRPVIGGSLPRRRSLIVIIFSLRRINIPVYASYKSLMTCYRTYLSVLIKLTGFIGASRDDCTVLYIWLIPVRFMLLCLLLSSLVWPTLPVLTSSAIVATSSSWSCLHDSVFSGYRICAYFSACSVAKASSFIFLSSRRFWRFAWISSSTS